MENRNTIRGQKRLCAVLHHKAGVTMVELIVSFMLIGIFMVAACQVMLSCARIYNQAKGTSYGRQVADTIMNKVAGELEGTISDISSVSSSTENDPAQSNDSTVVMKIYNNADGKIDKIDFFNATGSRIIITATGASKLNGDHDDKGAVIYNVPENDDTSYLLIHYYEVKTETADNRDKIRYQATNWFMDRAMYMGYQLTGLTFDWVGNDGSGTYPQEVIKVTVTVKSDRYGEYTAQRYVACSNFSKEALGDTTAVTAKISKTTWETT